MKTFDPIAATVREQQPFTAIERAHRVIQFHLHRVGNPDLAEDCRESARREIRHWRGEIIRAKLGEMKC